MSSHLDYVELDWQQLCSQEVKGHTHCPFDAEIIWVRQKTSEEYMKIRREREVLVVGAKQFTVGERTREYKCVETNSRFQ